MATAPVAAQQDDDTLGTFDFRVIEEHEKPLVKFNDGNFAFTIGFTSQEDRDAGKGVIYSAATFRTMTDLTEGEFRAEYPVVEDDFWHSEEMDNALEVTEKILREDWEKKLAGDVIYNNGDRLVKAMWLDDGNDGLDHLLRKDTNLTREEFLSTYPVTLDMHWPEDAADKLFAEWERMETAWEEGRQQVIKIAKQHGFVEHKCECEGCDNTGYAPEDESDNNKVVESLYDLHKALHDAGFHRNAAMANHCAQQGGLLFTPVAEEAEK
jgi:hypothetical protein